LDLVYPETLFVHKAGYILHKIKTGNMKPWIKKILIVIGIITALVIGEQLSDLIRYRIITVYICSGNPNKIFHVYHRCEDLYDCDDVIKVKLHSLEKTQYKPCPKCEKEWELEQEYKMQ